MYALFWDCKFYDVTNSSSRLSDFIKGTVPKKRIPTLLTSIDQIQLVLLFFKILTKHLG